jgi:hypothetical protein
MKKIVLIICLFTLTSFHRTTLSSTWNGTSDNQLLTGAALRDGASASGYYTVDVTIPSGDDLLIVSNTYIIAHTNVGGAPSQAGNQCPTKEAFSSQF